MESRLKNNPELAKQLIPEWSLGCRRLTPGNGYLETLNSDNCDLLVGHIAEVTETGIRMKDSPHREFDAIICATGFDVSFKPRWTMLGKNGKDLATEWTGDARLIIHWPVVWVPQSLDLQRTWCARWTW